MATQIQSTPTISGDDAKKFREQLRLDFKKELTVVEQQAKQAEVERMKSSYNAMVKLSNGQFY